MQINSANIYMQSSHHAETKHIKKERLNVWIDKTETQKPVTNITISNEAKTQALQTTQSDTTEITSESTPENIQVLKLMLEKVFGLEFNLFDANDFNKEIHHSNNSTNHLEADVINQNQRAGYGIEYDYHESYSESETTSFSAKGKIFTADGQQVQFNVELNMSRQFSENVNIRIREGDAKLVDPLIINFSGNAAELSENTFSFDLDADGSQENIALLKANSAFLAYDRNNDGKVNNGSELFGALTGDGFDELAKYDDDNNQFIDANDLIYNKLQVWHKNDNGEDSLIALADLDIGAIYLNDISTAFDVKTEENRMLGKIQSTSLYISNSGEVGTIQKLDFVV